MLRSISEPVIPAEVLSSVPLEQQAIDKAKRILSAQFPNETNLLLAAYTSRERIIRKRAREEIMSPEEKAEKIQRNKEVALLKSQVNNLEIDKVNLEITLKTVQAENAIMVNRVLTLKEERESLLATLSAFMDNKQMLISTIISLTEDKAALHASINEEKGNALLIITALKARIDTLEANEANRLARIQRPVRVVEQTRAANLNGFFPASIFSPQTLPTTTTIKTSSATVLIRVPALETPQTSQTPTASTDIPGSAFKRPKRQ